MARTQPKIPKPAKAPKSSQPKSKKAKATGANMFGSTQPTQMKKK